MCLKEMGKELTGWRVEIVATDLSTEVLEKAKSGIYTQFEVQRGLPMLMLVKYFSQVGEMWQIAPEIRAMVQVPAAQPAARLLAARHVRRGVLPQRADLFRSGRPRSTCSSASPQVTERDGFLVLGAAETVVGLTGARSSRSPTSAGLYAPPAWPPAAASTATSIRPATAAAGGSADRRLNASAIVPDSSRGAPALGTSHARHCWGSRRRNRPERRPATASNRSIGRRIVARQTQKPAPATAAHAP